MFRSVRIILPGRASLLAILLVGSTTLVSLAAPRALATPASVSLPVPPDTVPNLYMNPAHTNAATVPGVVPPLNRTWDITFPEPVTAPLLCQNKIVVLTYDPDHVDSALYVLNSDGSPVWGPIAFTYTTLDYVCDDDRVFIATNKGLLRAYDLTNGTPLWSEQSSADGPSPGTILSYKHTLYSGGSEGGKGLIRALREDTGAIIWRNVVDGNVSLALDDDALYATSLPASSLTKLDRISGTVLWHVALALPSVGETRVFEHKVFVGERVLAQVYDAQTGALLYTHPERPDLLAAFDHGKLFGLSGDATHPFDINTYNAATGDLLWTSTLPLTAPSRWVYRPLALNGLIYEITAEGVFGYDQDSGILRWSQALDWLKLGFIEHFAWQSQPTAGNGMLLLPIASHLIAFRNVNPPPAPTLTGLSTASVPVSGGDLVIDGTNFAPGITVRVDSRVIPATYLSPNQLRLALPPHQEGSVDIGVTNPDGQEAHTGPVFRYIRPGFAALDFAATWYGADLAVLRGHASRSWVYGPQSYLGVNELYTDSERGFRLVQYFDKARLELTERAGASVSVTNGLLTVELVSGERQDGDTTFTRQLPATVPVAGDSDDANGPTYASFNAIATLPGLPRPVSANANVIQQRISRDGTIRSLDAAPPVRTTNAYYVRETGHNIPDVFTRWLFQQPDWIATMGFPITEAYWAQVKVGGVQKQVLMQLYERRVLTFTPSNSVQYQIEYGNIGLHYYQWRYGTAPVASPFPAPHLADGIWRGTTSQGKPVFFTVENNMPSTFLYDFAADAGCQFSTYASVFTRRATIIDNVFYSTIRSAGGTTGAIKSAITTDSSASGTIDHAFGSDMPYCGGPLHITWTATKDPPTDEQFDGTWSGTSALGDPISFSIAHHTLRTLSFPFHKTGCDPDTLEYRFLDFAYPHTVSPANTVTLTLSPEMGVDFQLNGRFTSATTLSGSLRTTITPPPGYTSGCAGTQILAVHATRIAPTTATGISVADLPARNAWNADAAIPSSRTRGLAIMRWAGHTKQTGPIMSQ